MHRIQGERREAQSFVSVQENAGYVGGSAMELIFIISFFYVLIACFVACVAMEDFKEFNGDCHPLDLIRIWMMATFWPAAMLMMLIGFSVDVSQSFFRFVCRKVKNGKG
jgi:hypothetical protein